MLQARLALGIIFAVLSVAGCQSNIDSRAQFARTIALQSNMQERNIQAESFILRSYERIDEKNGKFIRIYIEGDGFAWVNRSTPSLDPTPLHPTALTLAQMDDEPNVAYLARPCQYNLIQTNGDRCPDKYWTSARFSPEAVAAVDAAITDIKNRYNIQHIEIVGFSGGGAIAVLIAARRNDIVNIRTVAGNLDTGLFARMHDVSPLDGSINPLSAAVRLSSIPQIHMTGENDTIVTRELFESFRAASGPSPCLRHAIVPDVTHHDGWQEKWAGLLKIPFSCDALNRTE